MVVVVDDEDDSSAFLLPTNNELPVLDYIEIIRFFFIFSCFYNHTQQLNYFHVHIKNIQIDTNVNHMQEI